MMIEAPFFAPDLLTALCARDMKKMNLDQVLEFYASALLGRARNVYPRGLHTRARDGCEYQNETIAMNFVSSVETYQEVRIEFDDWIRGGALTVRGNVFIEQLRKKCTEAPPAFFAIDDGAPVVTIEPVRVPKRIYDKYKRAHQRRNDGLPFAFPFDAWQDRNKRWWTYESEIIQESKKK